VFQLKIDKKKRKEVEYFDEKHGGNKNYTEAKNKKV
jgi:hypothetical protein